VSQVLGRVNDHLHLLTFGNGCQLHGARRPLRPPSAHSKQYGSHAKGGRDYIPRRLSLISECGDGMEPGRLAGGVDAEEDSHNYRKYECDEDCQGRNLRPEAETRTQYV